MLHSFEEKLKPKSLVSYIDIRWEDAEAYYNCGFKEVKKTFPKYYYVDNKQRYPRTNFTKQKLSVRLENFDATKSERYNMRNNGYYRIYDCGNIVLVKTYG